MRNVLCVRAACGPRIHPQYGLRAWPVRPRAHNALVTFTSLFKPVVTCSACRARNKFVVHAWLVRGPCLLSTFSVQMSKKRTELEPYQASTCSALRTHGVRTDHNPTAAEINSRTPPLHALTTEERVRTPYVISACKYCLRKLTWQSHGDLTL